MRKIRINLYSKEFKPKKQLLTLREMLSIWGILLLIMASLSYYTINHCKKLEHKHYIIQEQNSRIDSELIEIQELLAKMVPNEALKSKLEQIKKTHDSKKKFMDFLLANKDLKNNGYADFMKVLSLVTVKDISITRFKLDSHSVELYGDTINSAAIPQWLDRFKEYDSIKNMTFGALDISNNAEINVLNFSLTNPVYKEDKASSDQQ
jgi:Tfp pilus assembly protein PilN